MPDTIKQGRVDIVIFPNGGWEYIGRIEPEPLMPPDDILPQVLEFVAQHQNLPLPQKFTAYYGQKGRSINISFGDWEGEIPMQIQTPEELMAENPEFAAWMARREEYNMAQNDNNNGVIDIDAILRNQGSENGNTSDNK